MRAKKSTMLLTQAIQHTYGIRPVAAAPVIDWSAIRPRGWFEWDYEGDVFSRRKDEWVFDIEANAMAPRRPLNVGTIAAHDPGTDGFYTFPIGQFGGPSPLGIRYVPGAFEKFARNLPIVTPHHTIKSMRADKNGAVIGEVQFHSNPDNQRLMDLLLAPDDRSFSVGVRGFMQDGELLGPHTYNLLPRKIPTFSYEERFTPDREERTEWFMDALKKSSPIFSESLLETMRDAAGLPVRLDLSNQYQREAAEFLVKEGKGTYAECLDFVKKNMYSHIPFVIRPIDHDDVKPKGYHSREEKVFGGVKYWVYHKFPTRS